MSSLDYNTRHGSSVSSMENHTTLNSNSNGTGLKIQPSFGYSQLSHQQQRLPQQQLSQSQSQSHTTLGLSTLSTPQSSPQSTRVDYQHGRGHSSYQYSSESEDDHESFSSSQEPDLLGDLSRSSSAYRVRRDSGLPPIKMNAAKRLPHFNTSLTSMATDSVVEEEEEEEDEEDEARHPMSRRLHHEVDESSIPEEEEEDEDDQEDEVVQALDRDMAGRQTNNLFRKGDNIGSKQSGGPGQRMFSNQSPFHPFPSPPSRTTPTASAATTQVSTSFPSPTSSSTSIPAHGNGSQYSGSNSSLPRPVEPDRGPADLSNPSAALAEALSAARATAEARAKAQQQTQQQAALDALLVGHNRVHSQSADAGYQKDTSKRNSATSTDSNGNLSQVKIPVPDLSPTMQGYTGHLDVRQDSGRNTDGHLYPRPTAFTLSPTSSNPELTGSQSDSHSGSYGTQRPSTHNNTNNNNGRSVQPSTTKYGHPSVSSNMSRYTDDYNEQPQYARHREPSLLGTSYDSAQSIQHHGREGTYSRFAFASKDTDRGSLHSQGYMDDYNPSAVYPQGLSREPFGFQQDYTNQPNVDFPDESDSHATNDNHGRDANTSFHKQHHNNHGASAQSGHSASISLYPQTASSHSLALSEDLKDQISTEAEYIMNRNTELLRILSIRDDEIQTLQQELDHTLKVMHEYEDDLMAMHTAAAKPYETYRQTLDEIGHGMTQQDALLEGYQQENEKLTSQLKSSVEIRREAEKRHLQTVDRLKSEVESLRSELESSDQEKYGTTDLRFVLKQSQESHERAQASFKDKEEEYQAEISDLKERLSVTEQVLEEERKSKVEGMQKLERELQDFRAGYDGMLAQLQAADSGDLQPNPKRAPSSSSADEGQADTTVDDELERDIGLIKASLLKNPTKFMANVKSLSPSPVHIMDKLQQFKDPKPKALDRKLTSTETLTSGNMPAHADGEKLDLEQRLSRFEADVRQSLLRSSSMDSFSSVRSSGGTAIHQATQIKPLQHLHHQHHSNSRDDLRLSAMSEEHRLANKLRDRINSLNIENKRLHQELASLAQVLRVQQAERQRKVTHLEELLDMHENQASQRLDDVNTEEGQARVRKVIQGLLVRIRTKEAEAEFYHNAYLDKVMELDQMALANGKSFLVESPVEMGKSQEALGETPSSTPSPTASVIEALETRVRELERLNMEASFHLAAEQRRVQATETENGNLIREKLTLARMLEDQVDQLQSKLSLAEIARARLQDENNDLRQQQQQQQQKLQQSLKDARGASATPSGDRSGNNSSGQQQENTNETIAAMRSRMLSLTRQRDQLREQLQEAFDIQLTLQERSGPNSGGGESAEWSMEEFKRLERSLEEKSMELSIWKERAVALEKVVERIRMIKDRPEPTGLSLDRSLTMDSESMSTSSIGGSHDGVQHLAGRRASHHTLEELDQVVLRLEQRLERRDQELQEVVQEARRQTDRRLEAWKAKWVQVVQRKNAEIHRFQVELESLMAAVDRDRSRMATTATKK
ncbi:hypothetical protein K457DRAFT_131918 [Linnemannia elongata AG-77]|uniref:Uncharacterized protein n=1 Tax=Linnemannia elongata AG-77 TaxID=1314771 RepID=A0A197KHX5_9FUNG|nr:hypothetical protein K457DRAFT_131918 [Linnemannia elongata AG-77]